MKKLIYLLPVLFLTSCKEDTAFGGGLWFIPLVLLLAFGASAYRYYEFKKGKDNGANYAWVFAMIFLAAFILSVWRMLAEK